VGLFSMLIARRCPGKTQMQFTREDHLDPNSAQSRHDHDEPWTGTCEHPAPLEEQVRRDRSLGRPSVSGNRNGERQIEASVSGGGTRQGRHEGGPLE
jgi:hypothetical protein